MKLKQVAFIFAAVVTVLGIGLFAPKFYFRGTGGAPAPVIGFVVTSIDNPYFVEMVGAAKVAAQEAPILDLNVQAPERGAVDPERQRQLVDIMIARRCFAVLVVPADSNEIVSSVLSANRADVHFLVLDNDFNHKLAASRGAHVDAFIGSDNFEGGKMAGDFVIRQLGAAGGDVAVLEGVSGVQAATDRKNGFSAALVGQQVVRIVASATADWDRDKAYNVIRAILVAHPSLRAIFGSNDEMALGAAKAVSDAHRNGIMIVGYDATPDGRRAVAEGVISATIGQEPKKVAQLGIEYVRRLLHGENIPAQTKVPLDLITSTRPGR